MKSRSHGLTNFALVSISVLSTLLSNCSKDNPNPVNSVEMANERLSSALNSLVDSFLTMNPQIQNATFLVDIPYRNFIWIQAWGMADPQNLEPMTVKHSFRSASSSKLFTSAAVLRLIEEGKLSLEDTLGMFFPNDTLIDRVHVYQGVSYGAGITVRQLLNHTSGLPDYYLELDLNSDNIPDMIEAIFSDQDNEWLPRSLLELSINHLEPHFPPGQGFFYSDDNYLLLGLIIEKITGKSLQNVYKEQIFTPLEINDCWLEWHEQPVNGAAISHSFIDDIDITGMNTRFDWGGGGIMTTTESMNLFIRGLFSGKLIKSPDLMNELQSWVPVPDMPPETYYGLGIFKAYGSAGLLGHSGALGSVMYYWPDIDATICGTVNLLNAPLEPDLVLGIIETILFHTPSEQ